MWFYFLKIILLVKYTDITFLWLPKIFQKSLLGASFFRKAGNSNCYWSFNHDVLTNPRKGPTDPTDLHRIIFCISIINYSFALFLIILLPTVLLHTVDSSLFVASIDRRSKSPNSYAVHILYLYFSYPSFLLYFYNLNSCFSISFTTFFFCHIYCQHLVLPSVVSTTSFIRSSIFFFYI